MKSSSWAACAVAATTFALSVTSCPARAQDAAVARIIQQSGAAMGAAALRQMHVIRVDAKGSFAGLNGTVTQWLGVNDSRFAEATILPPLVQYDGYDGSVAWNRDRAGVVWNDGSDAGRSSEINSAYVATYQLWAPDAAGASVTSRGTVTGNGVVYDVLRVTPRGSLVPVDLWFDAQTHLLARSVSNAGETGSTTSYSDYRSVRGLMVAYAQKIESINGAGEAHVTGVQIDPSDGAAQLQRPAWSANDFAMAGGAQSTTVPIEIAENHVYLDVMLNGKGPFRFIFDTGGQNVMDPSVASALAASSAGSAQASGVGATTESVSFTRVKELRVGNAVLRDQDFAVLPIRAGFGITTGTPADGIIGWEVLARFVTTFNYNDRNVVLSLMPSSNAGGATLPFVFRGTQPQITCGIDGIPSECTIDTGSRSTITLTAPFLAAHPQVIPAQISAVGINGFGIGGPSLGKLGRLQDVSLGAIHVPDAIADFTAQRAGAFAQPFVAANIGGGLLRRFDVTFDYRAGTMTIVPNASFSTRESYERAGLFLIERAGMPVVADVRPGTPAAEAGVAKGDTIISVNGAPTDKQPLAEVRAYFSQPAGTAVKLTLRDKAGVERQIIVTLRDWV